MKLSPFRAFYGHRAALSPIFPENGTPSCRFLSARGTPCVPASARQRSFASTFPRPSVDRVSAPRSHVQNTLSQRFVSPCALASTVPAHRLAPSRAFCVKRTVSSNWREKERQTAIDDLGWWLAGAVFMSFSLVWIAVPLYRMFCQQAGQGAADRGSHKEYSPPPLENYSNPRRLIKITFESTVHETLHWKVQPQQKRVIVACGETALAFYRAKNNLPYPIIGTSVYHIMPPEAGLYFNKIQCFCFDEQLLNPAEEVDLPILFYLDTEFGDDPRFDHIDEVTLSYIFFESDSDIPEDYEELVRQREFQKEKYLVRPLSEPIAAAAPVPATTAR